MVKIPLMSGGMLKILDPNCTIDYRIVARGTNKLADSTETSMNSWHQIKRGISTSAVLIAFLAFMQSANATILHGYLEHQDATTTQSDPTSGAQEVPVANSYPDGYQGSWHCVTTVIDSGVQTVAAGQIMTSDVNFAKVPDGRIVAKWSQPGWTETQASITRFSPTDARVDRTNYYTAEGMENSWAARSRDQFSLTDTQTIVAQSYVDQYIDGQFVGRYRTKSVLHKQPNEIASQR
jgi:hypothetical protein